MLGPVFKETPHCLSFTQVKGVVGDAERAEHAAVRAPDHTLDHRHDGWYERPAGDEWVDVGRRDRLNPPPGGKIRYRGPGRLPDRRSVRT
jgi:hypothetical protein